MAVSFIDFPRLHKPFHDELLEVFERSLSTNDFVLGPMVAAFEQNFASQMGARHALGVASGTDALLLTLQAIGIGPGDEIICPVFGFVATADVVFRLGGSIVFVDVGDDLNMDIESVRAALTDRTKAIIAVHLNGLACDMDALTQIANDYGIYLIEDCAQSCGGSWGERSLGTFGIAGCFSFYPSKNLGAFGDGGLVLTDSDELAERIRLYRDHGADADKQFLTIGYNSRLDSIQAGVLDVKLPNLAEDVADRQANAAYYNEHIPQDSFVLPPFREDGTHAYNNYTVRCAQRDELRTFLAERQIDTKIYYPVPMHLEPCFEMLGYAAGHFPKAEQAAAEVLSLPVFPGLTKRELEEVVHMMDLFVKTHPVPVVS